MLRANLTYNQFCKFITGPLPEFWKDTFKSWCLVHHIKMSSAPPVDQIAFIPLKFYFKLFPYNIHQLFRIATQLYNYGLIYLCDIVYVRKRTEVTSTCPRWLCNVILKAFRRIPQDWKDLIMRTDPDVLIQHDQALLISSSYLPTKTFYSWFQIPVYHFEKPLVLELYRGLPSWVTHIGIPRWCSNMVPTCDGRLRTLPCVKICVKFSQIA